MPFASVLFLIFLVLPSLLCYLKNTQNDEYLQEAATSIRIANEADIVREQCRAREDALRRERTLERDKNRLLEEKASLRKQLAAFQAQSSKQ